MCSWRLRKGIFDPGIADSPSDLGVIASSADPGVGAATPINTISPISRPSGTAKLYIPHGEHYIPHRERYGPKNAASPGSPDSTADGGPAKGDGTECTDCCAEIRPLRVRDLAAGDGHGSGNGIGGGSGGNDSGSGGGIDRGHEEERLAVGPAGLCSESKVAGEGTSPAREQPMCVV